MEEHQIVKHRVQRILHIGSAEHGYFSRIWLSAVRVRLPVSTHSVSTPNEDVNKKMKIEIDNVKVNPEYDETESVKSLVAILQSYFAQARNNKTIVDDVVITWGI